MNIEACSICGKSLLRGYPHFELIIPLYFSENHLDAVLIYVNSLNNDIPGGIALTFVADGRHDDYEAALTIIQNAPFPYRVLKLSRNFGVGPAIHAALSESRYCISTAFGSDLQEPIDLFRNFFKVLASGESQLALGYRTKRDDPFLSKSFARFYWWINRKFINTNSPSGGFDVFAMSSNVRSHFVKLSELNTNFTSQLLWIGFDPKWIGFERKSRQQGKSTWSHRRKFKLFADSLYGYTSKPITWITLIGFFASIAFLLIGVITLIGKVLDLISVPGYVMTVLLISVGQSLVLFSIGLIGGYIVRTFENSTDRPHFIIESRSKNSNDT